MAYDENIYAKIISGELTKEDETRLRASGEWDEIQQILEVSSSLSLPKYNQDAGYEKLKELKRSKPQKTKVRRLYSIALSSAALLVLVAGFVLFMQGGSESLQADYGQIAEVKLGDNTKVTLNDGSTLNYTDLMEGEDRLVELKGEGFFQVVPGNKFIVKSDNGKVEVLGTEFNVRAWGDVFEVECYEGKVAVAHLSQRREIKAGEAVRFKNGAFSEIQAISLSGPQWMNGVSRFEDVDISDVIKELERQYNLQVKSSVAIQSFSGAFGHDNLEKALQSICIPLGLSFDIIDEKSIVISE